MFNHIFWSGGTGPLKWCCLDLLAHVTADWLKGKEGSFIYICNYPNCYVFLWVKLLLPSFHDNQWSRKLHSSAWRRASEYQWDGLCSISVLEKNALCWTWQGRDISSSNSPQVLFTPLILKKCIASRIEVNWYTFELGCVSIQIFSGDWWE